MTAAARVGHTPGPWKLRDNDSDEVIEITSQKRVRTSKVEIATVVIGWDEPFDSEQRANAAHIVKCVNGYDALAKRVETLEAERDALAEALCELEADARRYREFWRNPVAQHLDDIGLQIIRYNNGGLPAFDKAWCDEQLDAAYEARLALSSSQPQEHFPATSEPERCCYRLNDGSRCAAARDTHSFCMTHAQQLRSSSQPQGGV